MEQRSSHDSISLTSVALAQGNAGSSIIAIEHVSMIDGTGALSLQGGLDPITGAKLTALLGGELSALVLDTKLWWGTAEMRTRCVM